MDIKDIKEVQGLFKVLNKVSNDIKRFGNLLVKNILLSVNKTSKCLSLNIYNELNTRITQMEKKGIKPILVLGDDTDSYLSCYLFNLLRNYDGLDNITIGGVLIYKGKDKGIYVDNSLSGNNLGLVFLDTDIVLPNNSVSLTNHLNLMDDYRIININNYTGCKSLEDYKNKYPLGTTQILLSVCKSKGIEIPKEFYNYFLRCDMSRLPKKVFMSNTLYHLKVLNLDKEFKEHIKDVRKNKIKNNYKLFNSIYLDFGKLYFNDIKYPIIKKLKEFNSPHYDVRLNNLKKIYDLDTVRMNVEDDGILVGDVYGGTFTVYTHKNKYYYTRLISV